jgi:hypothetical protein
VNGTIKSSSDFLVNQNNPNTIPVTLCNNAGSVFQVLQAGGDGSWLYGTVAGDTAIRSFGKLMLAAGSNNPNATITLGNSNGRVGIGCNAPSVTLDVSGIIRGSNIIAASAYAQNAVARIVMGPTSSTNYDYCSLIQSRCTPDNNMGSYLSFWTHGTSATYGDPTERMTIDSGGNVGIGITTPGYTLDVVGTARFSSGSNYVGPGQVGQVAAVYPYVYNGADSCTHFEMGSSRTESGNYNGAIRYSFSTWKTSGNGAAINLNLNRIQAGSGGYNNPLQTSAALTVYNDGNIGINYNTPAYRLDVVGQQRVTNPGGNVLIVSNSLDLTSNTLTTPNTLSSIVLCNAGIGGTGSTFYNNSILFSTAGYGGCIGGGLQNGAGGFLSLGTMYGNSNIYPLITLRSFNGTSGNVGINCNAPQATLDVNGGLQVGGSGNSAIIGSSTGLMIQGYAGDSCYIRTNGGTGTATGSIYFGAGGTNTFTISSAGALSGITSIQASGALILTGTSNYHLYNDGVALIAQTNGTSAGYAKLAYGAGSWQSISDLRVKNVLSNITGATEALSQITPVYYTFKGDPTNKRFVGVIAQEVQQHYPELVDVDPNPDKMISLSYSELVAPLIAAVKELSARLSNVEAKLAATTGS